MKKQRMENKTVLRCLLTRCEVIREADALIFFRNMYVKLNKGCLPIPSYVTSLFIMKENKIYCSNFYLKITD